MQSYYLLILYLPALYFFYQAVTWATCEPISEIGPHLKLVEGAQIPVGATCFQAHKMQLVTFHYFPPLEENPLLFGGLIILVVCLFGILSLPTVRLLKIWPQ